MFINNAMVFQLNNTTFKRKVTKENIILLNAFSSSYYDFIYPYDGSVTDMNIWGFEVHPSRVLFSTIFHMSVSKCMRPNSTH